jgi:hypothetical protein
MDSASSYHVSTQEFKASRRHCLDTLPVEIIRRIASNVPFSSITSLLKVNRMLYNSCNDWTVFQANMAKNASYTCPKWYLATAVQSDKSILPRYACADSKAAQFCHSVDEFAPNQLARWAPHLTAMHREYSQRSPNIKYDIRKPFSHRELKNFLVELNYYLVYNHGTAFYSSLGFISRGSLTYFHRSDSFARQYTQDIKGHQAFPAWRLPCAALLPHGMLHVEKQRSQVKSFSTNSVLFRPERSGSGNA